MDGRPKYPLLCDCGKQTYGRATRLIDGSLKSCGCLKVERFTAFATKHGLREHELYDIWLAMRQRCSNPKANQYKDYGGRGISVDPSWDSFERFLADMGERPPGFTLERKDNSAGYGPNNCEWAPRAEQARNTRKNVYLSYRGLSATQSVWADAMDITPSVLLRRRRANKPEELMFKELSHMTDEELKARLAWASA